VITVTVFMLILTYAMVPIGLISTHESENNPYAFNNKTNLNLFEVIITLILTLIILTLTVYIKR
jgi:hypothetical protein